MIKRYRIKTDPTSRQVTLEERPDGELVKHDDHLDAIAEERQITLSIETMDRMKAEEYGRTNTNE